MARFRVMSWNVENLFQPGDLVSRFPRKVMDSATYEAKVAYLARTIAQAGPDVVALQELGGNAEAVAASLKDLNRLLQGAYPHSRVSSHADSRGIRVAFLSKLPVQAHQDIVDFAPGELSQVANWQGEDPITTLGRGALEIVVAPREGLQVRLLTLHLKSKLITYNRPEGTPPFEPHDEHERALGAALALLRRTAEAATVRIYLNHQMAQDPSVHALVFGDLNDEPRAATSQILLGPVDKDAARQDKGDPVRLYNLMAALPMRGGVENDVWLLPENERYTRIYEGQGELIDHILASKGLLGDPAKLKTAPELEVRSLVEGIQGQSVTADASARVGEHVPDHAPILATFRL